MSELTLDYGSLQNLLEQIEADVGAAEWHGALCGLLCADARANEREWLSLVFGDDAVTLELDERRVFDGFFRRTFSLLYDPGLDFNLLLPDDEVSLGERVDALGEWCAGFMYGLGVGGVRDFDKLPEDCADTLQDVLEISRVFWEDDVVTEMDELRYVELSEYVRMGVIMLNNELKPREYSQAKKTLH